jgi:hypothetical protein
MGFSLDLSRAVKRAKGKQELVVRRVMLEVFKKIVMKSPVDTGRFRANWEVSVGGYSRDASEKKDKSGASTLNKIIMSVNSIPLSGQKIFLTNALPYAIRLENGWSKTQAPQGMVKLSLAEITAKYGT